jgi:NAD(P)-dependent dehydrogenase (short-subunit alcohol dehydrogenase family)
MGGSSGFGRSTCLKLTRQAVKVDVYYYPSEAVADDMLLPLHASESDGRLVDAVISRPEDLRRLFQVAQDRFGALGIFVINARAFADPTHRTRRSARRPP